MFGFLKISSSDEVKTLWGDFNQLAADVTPQVNSVADTFIDMTWVILGLSAIASVYFALKRYLQTDRNSTNDANSDTALFMIAVGLCLASVVILILEHTLIRPGV